MAGKAAQNEPLKLEAQTLNAVGLGFVAVGVLQPLFAGQFTVVSALRVALSSSFAYLPLCRQAPPRRAGGRDGRASTF